MTEKPIERAYDEALYRMFKEFALEDQRSYYRQSVRTNRDAGIQVNRIAAIFALITGLSSALAGLLVSAFLVPGSFANNGNCARNYPNPEQTAQVIEVDAPAFDLIAQTETLPTERPLYCRGIEIGIIVLLLLAVVAPALGAAFNTLADLYQWDRLVAIYDSALENLEVADAQSPLDDMKDDLIYRAALQAYAQGTLSVMRDETAQWGQLIKTPTELQRFVEHQRQKAGAVGGDAARWNREAEDNESSADQPRPPQDDSTPQG